MIQFPNLILLQYDGDIYSMVSVSISLQCLWRESRCGSIGEQLLCTLSGYLNQAWWLPTACPCLRVTALLKLESQSTNLCPLVWKWVRRILGLSVLLCGWDRQPELDSGQKESWPWPDHGKISQRVNFYFTRPVGDLMAWSVVWCEYKRGTCKG